MAVVSVASSPSRSHSRARAAARENRWRAAWRPSEEKATYGDGARFQAVRSVMPLGVLGLSNFNSSAVRDVTIRRCSGPPAKFANLLALIWLEAKWADLGVGP